MAHIFRAYRRNWNGLDFQNMNAYNVLKDVPICQSKFRLPVINPCSSVMQQLGNHYHSQLCKSRVLYMHIQKSVQLQTSGFFPPPSVVSEDSKVPSKIPVWIFKSRWTNISYIGNHGPETPPITDTRQCSSRLSLRLNHNISQIWNLNHVNFRNHLNFSSIG